MTSPIGQVDPLSMFLPWVLTMLTVALVSLVQCKKKNKEEVSKGVDGTGTASTGPRPPTKGGMAGTHDPNYQTLAAVPGGCFGDDKAKAAGGGGGGGGAASPAGPQAPADANAVAGTHDPNYQTLAGVGGECFGADKKAAGGGGGGAASPGPPKPGAGGIAGTHDPNYQTLAGINNNDCFGADKKK